MAQLGDAASAASVQTSLDAIGMPVVAIAGELDISNVDAIEGELQPVIVSKQRVSFDLSAVTFMDSSGIAMLLRAADAVGSVILCNPSAVVRRVIGATGLTEVFEIVDD
jgi:anti-sigma B factor antagonist